MKRLALVWLVAPLYAQTTAPAILEKRCLACHGQTQTSGLDLRSLETIKKGGKRGPALVPGHAAESLLMRAVMREGDLKMPPGAPLPAAEIDALRAWIDGGAAWPKTPIGQPEWWSFRKVTRPAGSGIDSFISRALTQKKLHPLPPADKRTLIRRAYLDLHGLPPAPEEVDAFLSNDSPEAYEKLIDRLLASPRYGERWGRHWLDVVRYADTGGFETDMYYANAWRYRDYVIQSFNDDKPYDRFVQEQIAGDEIWPDDIALNGSYDIPPEKQKHLEARIGTTLYTIGPTYHEAALNGEQLRYEWMTDAVDVTGAAFLGLTIGCARCHDHKFDPISQRDYHRMMAVFAASEERDIPVVSKMEQFGFKSGIPRTLQVEEYKAAIQRLDDKKGEKNKSERERLLIELGKAALQARFTPQTATVLAHAEIVHDVRMTVRGDFHGIGDKVGPGFPQVLGGAEDIPDANRRKSLALWLTAPEHPLTARVIVNRVWGWHFGRGLVATPSDFGRQGDRPSHPELLDWLASEFVSGGWSLKKLHRSIMLSEAYRRASAGDEHNAKIDPDNRYLWRMNRQRMDAETLRDTVLAVSGTLNLKMGGRPVIPPLSDEEKTGMWALNQWPVALDPAEHNRRSVYLYVKRSFPYPMFQTFDVPDSSESCPRRDTTTVAPQALALLNSGFMLQQAATLSQRVQKEDAGPDAWIDAAWRRALGRAPTPPEKERAQLFLADSSLKELCLVLLNLNEFLYVD